MSHPEGIIFTLCHSGKAADTLVFTVCVELCFSAGEYFVSIGLMTHIPDYLVIWCIIDVMQGYGQLHHPEACPEMAGIVADLINDMLP